MLTVEQYTPLGIEILDEQHRNLIRLMGTLHEAVVRRPVMGERPVEEAFSAFVLAAVRHFATEEAMMGASEYPRFIEHKREHTALLRQVNHHYESYLDGSGDLVGDIEPFLEKWIAEHTTGADREYIPYLKG